MVVSTIRQAFDLLFLICLYLTHSVLTIFLFTQIFSYNFVSVCAGRPFIQEKNISMSMDIYSLSFLNISINVSSNVHTDGFPSKVISALRLEGRPNYFVPLKVGTPPRSFFFIMDTASQITWVQCHGCSPGFEQENQPLYGDPESPTSTAKMVGYDDEICQKLPIRWSSQGRCGFSLGYNDGKTYSSGELITETLTLGDAGFHEFGMGCGMRNLGDQAGAAGTFALGRGALSFPKQMGFSFFSYCLVARTSLGSSTLEFGGVMPPEAMTGSLVTPPNKLEYYIPLRGISIGGERLNLDPSVFAVLPSAEGGVILDTGTTITMFNTAVYNEFLRVFTEVMDNLRLPRYTNAGVDLRMCYVIENPLDLPKVPRVVFHLGDGKSEIQWPLPFQAVMITIFAETYCVGIIEQRGENRRQIIGSLAQQAARIYLDLESQSFGISPCAC
ncbi:hypothetical protein ACHQM5_001112 [Ranunculus cassubicifolius]